MRYIVYGAGAIGGVLGGRLHAIGRDVTLIARGQHLDALRSTGLRLQSSEHDDVHRVSVASSPAEARVAENDIVILGMKTQDTAAALEELATVAPSTTSIFCAQNGVENERLASRFFSNVYGMYVFIFAASLSPGVVQCFTEPSGGICNLGRYPRGRTPLADHVAADLVAAGFDSRAEDDIMRWKYGKLLGNIGNALQALATDTTELMDVYALAQAEGEACYSAAGIGHVSWADQVARRAALMPLALVNGEPFPGGSSWQSLKKGSTRLETDYLNGEIVLLGRLTGVPTPVNELLQRLVRDYASRGGAPGAMTTADLRAQVEAVAARAATPSS